MPLNNRELSTELVKLQTKVNKTKEELEREIQLTQDYQKMLDKKITREKIENLIFGIILLIGVVIVNYILPRMTNITFISTNFSPRFGPVDLLAVVWGGWNIWKGLRK